ncbi:MAG: hypothetical protein NTV52_19180 [Acidobacteria bacterium]|nr:hypothetical protein [Acidobacteriota bacterium]
MPAHGGEFVRNDGCCSTETRHGRFTNQGGIDVPFCGAAPIRIVKAAVNLGMAAEFERPRRLVPAPHQAFDAI